VLLYKAQLSIGGNKKPSLCERLIRGVTKAPAEAGSRRALGVRACTASAGAKFLVRNTSRVITGLLWENTSASQSCFQELLTT